MSQPMHNVCNLPNPKVTCRNVNSPYLRDDNCNSQFGAIAYLNSTNRLIQNNSLWFDGHCIWVDGSPICAGGGGGGIVTANNGLNLSTSTNVQLGGSLIHDTQVDIGTHSLTFGQTGDNHIYLDPTQEFDYVNGVYGHLFQTFAKFSVGSTATINDLDVDVGTSNINFGYYQNFRRDVSTPTNFLYTDINGRLQSQSISLIAGTKFNCDSGRACGFVDSNWVLNHSSNFNCDSGKLCGFLTGGAITGTGATPTISFSDINLSGSIVGTSICGKVTLTFNITTPANVFATITLPNTYPTAVVPVISQTTSSVAPVTFYPAGAGSNQWIISTLGVVGANQSYSFDYHVMGY